jgi:hypothetical protein
MLEPFTPLKIRPSVLKDIKPLLAELLSEKGTGRDSQGKRPSAAPRGPKLDLVTPEEEAITFQDKSDPPMNTLIEDLKNLNVSDSVSGGDAKPTTLPIPVLRQQLKMTKLPSSPNGGISFFTWDCRIVQKVDHGQEPQEPYAQSLCNTGGDCSSGNG